MRLGYGIFLGYLLVALLAAYFVKNVFVDEIKPSARQAMEDSLVDTANLLAELSVNDFVEGTLASGSFASRVSAYRARDLDASIWGLPRKDPGFRIYVTDLSGIVRYDSENLAVGHDYSRWNDVYLTLKGKYGVRSSPDSASEAPSATTMYVAAPIRSDGRIIGSLTVAKSNLAVEPFIARTQAKIEQAGYWLLAVSLLIGLVVSFGLSHSLQKLVTYAEGVTRGERTTLPKLALKEINTLGDALHLMREKLEGKRYVEDYIVTLTHEMKSPLTAIKAATELAMEPMPEAQRQTFLISIADQSNRLQSLIERMLEQAKIEHMEVLDDPKPLDLTSLVDSVLVTLHPRLEKKRLNVTFESGREACVQGDPFLLEQAIRNLFENAIDFSPEQTSIEVSIHSERSRNTVAIRDHGPGIPDYALTRVFERYYSLPRPASGTKSTGLGLSFVQEVALLHGGTIEIQNHPQGGALARLTLPNFT